MGGLSNIAGVFEEWYLVPGIQRGGADMEFIIQAWEYKFSLVPVLAAYLVFEISTVIRRLARMAYTPIYFMFFPLGHADGLYAYYFNEDDFYIGASQTPAEKSRIRKRIISISVFSMIFASVINPALAGVFCAKFLSPSQFREFFWVLIVTKLILISFSLYRTRLISFVGKSGAFPWLALIYAAYLIIIARVVDTSYAWAADSLARYGLVESVLQIVDFIVFDFVIYIIFVALIGAAISYWMTDPDNIPELDVITDPELRPEE